MSGEAAALPLPEPVLKTVLYAGAPFFSWPWKPALNALTGQPYERAYHHFRRDHQDPLNLIYHCMCLVFQLGFNFGLNSEIAKAIGQRGPKGEAIAEWFPLATALAWAWTLIRNTKAPLVVRILSISAIAIGHRFRHEISSRWQQLSWLTAVPEMLAVQVFVINKAKDTSGSGRRPLDVGQLLKLVALRTGLRAAVDRGLAGKLASAWGRGVTNALVAAFMLKVCQDPFGGGKATKSPFIFGLVGWILSVLTDQPWLFFYSGGFLASLSQGVAHHFAGEEGTLPQLANIADEFAHTTYFPNLLLHSVYQSLTSGRGPAAA